MAQGKRWVVDMDLEKFFDRVNHDILMARWRRRSAMHGCSADPPLSGGGDDAGRLGEPRTEGTPQGGPLSPLLANSCSPRWTGNWNDAGHAFCRYADDCNIYVASERAGVRLFCSLTTLLDQRLKLKVNTAKSAVARPWQRKFLGYSLTWHRNRSCASRSRACRS